MAMTGGSTTTTTATAPAAAQRADLDATRAMSDIFSAGAYGPMDFDKEAGVRELASVIDKYLASAYSTLQCGEQSDAARPLHTPRHRMEWYAVIYNACNGDPLRSRALYVQLALSVVNILERQALYPLLRRCIEPDALTIEPCDTRDTSNSPAESTVQAMSAVEQKGGSRIRSLRNTSFNLVKKLLLIRREGSHNGSPRELALSNGGSQASNEATRCHVTRNTSSTNVERSRSESNISGGNDARSRANASSARSNSSSNGGHAVVRSSVHTPRVTVSLPCTSTKYMALRALHHERRPYQSNVIVTNDRTAVVDTMTDSSVTGQARHCHSESCWACETGRRTTGCAAQQANTNTSYLSQRLQEDEREMAERVRREEREGQLSMTNIITPTTNVQSEQSKMAAVVIPVPSVKVLRAFQDERQVFLAFRRVVLSCFSYLDQYYTRRFGMDTIAMLCVKLFYVVFYEPLRPLLQRETALLIHYLRQRQDSVTTPAVVQLSSTASVMCIVNDKDDAERVRLVRDSLHTRQDLLAAMTATASYLVMDMESKVTSGGVEKEATSTNNVSARARPTETSRGSKEGSSRVVSEMSRQPRLTANAGTPLGSSFLRGATTIAAAAAAVPSSFSSTPPSSPVSSSASSSSCYVQRRHFDSGSDEGDEEEKEIKIPLQGIAELRARLESDQLPRCLMTQSARYLAMSQHAPSGTAAVVTTNTPSETIPSGLQRDTSNSALAARRSGAVGTIVRDVPQRFEELLLQDYGTHYLAALDEFYNQAATQRVGHPSSSKEDKDRDKSRMYYLAWVCAVMRLERRMLGADQPNFLRRRVHDILVRRLLTQPHRALILDERCGFRALLELWDTPPQSTSDLVSALNEIDPELIRYNATSHHRTTSSASTITNVETTTVTDAPRCEEDTSAMDELAVLGAGDAHVIAAIAKYVAVFVATQEDGCLLLLASILAAKIIRDAAAILTNYFISLERLWQEEQQTSRQGTAMRTAVRMWALRRASLTAAFMRNLVRLFARYGYLIRHAMLNHNVFLSAFLDAGREVMNSARWSRAGALAASAKRARWAGMLGTNQLPSVLLSRDAGARAMAPLEALATRIASATASTQTTGSASSERVALYEAVDSHASSSCDASSGSVGVVAESISLPRLLAEYSDRLIRQIVTGHSSNNDEVSEQARMQTESSPTQENKGEEDRNAKDVTEHRECVALLSYLTQLVPLLDHCELFIEHYRRRLIRRLIEYGSQRSDSLSVVVSHWRLPACLTLEQRVLVQLEHQLDPSTTHRLQAIVHDCIASTQAQRDFETEKTTDSQQQQHSSTNPLVPCTSDQTPMSESNSVPGFKAYVLTATHWPICAPVWALPVMPQSWQRGMHAYAAYYKRLHPSRVLRWLGAYAVAVLQANFAAGCKELTVNVYQAAILLALSEANCVYSAQQKEEGRTMMMSAEELVKRTGLSLRTLQPHLRSLLHLTRPQGLLVCRTPQQQRQTISVTDQRIGSSSSSSSSAVTGEGCYYAINADFAHTAGKLRLCSPSYAAQAFLSAATVRTGAAGNEVAGNNNAADDAVVQTGSVQQVTTSHMRATSTLAKAVSAGVDTNALAMLESPREHSSSSSAMQYGLHASRRIWLEAAIMRCMKQHRTLSAPELLRLVNRSLCDSSSSSTTTPRNGAVSGTCVRGGLAAVSSRELKLRIEELIDRDYLRRSEEDDNVFEYIS